MQLMPTSTVYLPSEIQQEIYPDLNRFGDVVLSKKVLGWVADSEKNLPYLKTWDTFGKRRDELITSEGWRNLQDLGIEEGIVAIPHENKHKEFSRVHQFIKSVTASFTGLVSPALTLNTDITFGLPRILP